MKRAAWWGPSSRSCSSPEFFALFGWTSRRRACRLTRSLTAAPCRRRLRLAAIFIPQGWGREPRLPLPRCALLLIVRDSADDDPPQPRRWSASRSSSPLAYSRRSIGDWRAGLIAAAIRRCELLGRVCQPAMACATSRCRSWSTLTAISFFRAKSSVKFALAGILLGLTFYTYQSSRLLPFLFVLIVVWLWLFRAQTSGRNLARAAALFRHRPDRGHAAVRLPDRSSRRRVGRAFMLEPLDALRGGDPVPLLNSLWRNAAILFADAGDWTSNVPGQPVFPSGAGLLFCVRRPSACLVRWRNVQRITLPLWLVIGLLPSMVTSGPHYMRLIGALAPAMALLGDRNSRTVRLADPARVSFARTKPARSFC